MLIVICASLIAIALRLVVIRPRLILIRQRLIEITRRLVVITHAAIRPPARQAEHLTTFVIAVPSPGESSPGERILASSQPSRLQPADRFGVGSDRAVGIAATVQSARLALPALPLRPHLVSDCDSGLTAAVRGFERSVP
jgi:hypothetical protein